MFGAVYALVTGRSPKWPTLRRPHLAAHPTCAACGARLNLAAHHINPTHAFPDRELDPTNLMTLCESPARNCHLTFGHLYSWESWNPTAAADAAAQLARVRARPR